MYSWMPLLVVVYVGQCLCNEKLQHQSIQRDYGVLRIPLQCEPEEVWLCMFLFSPLRVCLFTSIMWLPILGPEPRGRAGYPPVAPKPSYGRMASGGVGPEEAGQGSPVVMKKMVPVQSSRPQSAASATAHQGDTKLVNNHFLTSLQRVPSKYYVIPSGCVQSQMIEFDCRSNGRRWRSLHLWCSAPRAESSSCSKRGEEAACCLQCSSRSTAASPSWGGGGSQRLWLWWSQWE